MANVSKTDIANLALQKLGAKRITDIADNSPNARAANFAYPHTLRSVLRKHAWNRAIKRAEIAADAAAPPWGRTNSFSLPGDFIRLLPPYPEDIYSTYDWQIEGQKIYTDDGGPLYMRYIGLIDPSEMDDLLTQVVACHLGIQICTEVTGSTTRKATLYEELKDWMIEARKANAFENIAPEPPLDSWVEARMI